MVGEKVMREVERRMMKQKNKIETATYNIKHIK
jgi:hypothetical protein